MFLNTQKKNNQLRILSDPLSPGSGYQDYFEGKSDREIWQLFKKGHEGAFRIIYEHNIDLLFQYGHRFTGDDELIKDCIHDIFVELRTSKNLSDTDSIKFYLLRVFRNKIRRTIEFSARDRKVYEDQRFMTDPNEPSFEARLIQQQLNEEQKVKLKECINSLPARQREALYHFYQENMSYKEVAVIMGFDCVRSARNVMYKALDTLRTFF